MAMSRFLSFATYFLVGWYLRNNDIISRLSNLKSWQKLILVALGVVSCFAATKIPIEVFWGHEPIQIAFYKIVIFKECAWIIAIINSMALFIIVPKSISISEGRHTLAYYLLHTLILFPVIYYVADLLPNKYFITAVVLLLILGAIALLRRISWIDRLLCFKPLENLEKINKRG